MYNANDCVRGIPADGFHIPKYREYDSKRPLLERTLSLHDPVNTNGLCLRTSNVLSHIYYVICREDWRSFNDIVLDPRHDAETLFIQYWREA